MWAPLRRRRFTPPCATPTAVTTGVVHLCFSLTKIAHLAPTIDGDCTVDSHVTFHQLLVIPSFDLSSLEQILIAF